MGSQTLEILRSVWASLTGGYFFDPHQSVFCNVIHLYLWLFLLCSPFVAYLYFPATWLTWSLYCIFTSFTIFVVKIMNMALHQLYDRALTMSTANLKNHFFKITKETVLREEDNAPGIEMKVLRNNASGASVDQTVMHDGSEGNSILSIENGIIDLKVDVHRKNSSESIELMFYAPSSGNSQQDQQSLAGSASVSKSLRSNNAANISNDGSIGTGAAVAPSGNTCKYLSVHPEHINDAPLAVENVYTTHRVNSHNLTRKSSDDYKRRQRQRPRLERQSSLDATSESAIIAKFMRNQQSDSMAPRNETFLYSQAHPPIVDVANSEGAGSSRLNSSTNKLSESDLEDPSTSAATATAATTTTMQSSLNIQNRLKNFINDTTPRTAGQSNTALVMQPSSIPTSKNMRLQRHRSSETHEERLKRQTHTLFLPIHQEHTFQHHRHGGGVVGRSVSRVASSSGTLATASNDGTNMLLGINELEPGLGGSAKTVTSHASSDNRVNAMQTWILGSSSDVYIEDDNCTKSDIGIEQIDSRRGIIGFGGRTALLLQQQHLNSHLLQQQIQQQQQQQKQQQTAARQQLQRHGGIKRRRHSNTTILNSDLDRLNTPTAPPGNLRMLPGVTDGKKSTIKNIENRQTGTVRRIKSAALELNCQRPSISNLSPHPNSVEAIGGQQQQQRLKNSGKALLPPPSKTLVRNPHLNLCPKFGGSFGGSSGSGASFNFGNSVSDSTLALIEPTEVIKEQPMENVLERCREEQTTTTTTTTDAKCDAKENKHYGNEEFMDSINQAIRNANGHLDADDDDEVDDVPKRSRRKALDCRRARHDAEFDVAGILADDDDDDDNDDDDENQYEDDDDIDVDADEFKDFDNNLENILNDLRKTQNQLDDLKASYDRRDSQSQNRNSQEQNVMNIELENAVTPTQDDCADGEDNDPEDRESMHTQRERLPSTDSETDNNNKGSQSPLLSGPSSSSKNADRALRIEISALQKQHKIQNGGSEMTEGVDASQKKENPSSDNSKQQQQHHHHHHPQFNLLRNRGADGDSGCPSSDCEQISASSKDMLLSGLDAPETRPTSSSDGNSKKTHLNALRTQSSKNSDKLNKDNADEDSGEYVDMTQNNKSASATNNSSSVIAKNKNLGAIPKILKYREVNELKINPETNRNKNVESSSSSLETTNVVNPNFPMQIYKRRGVELDNLSFERNASGASTKAISRTSSSASSSSSNAETFSTEDVEKILWIMHGGVLDDLGRPIAGTANIESASITMDPNAFPSEISSVAHYSLYQDAMLAYQPSSLTTQYSGNMAGGLMGAASVDTYSISERSTSKGRRNSKQISEQSLNVSMNEFPQHTSHDFHSGQHLIGPSILSTLGNTGITVAGGTTGGGSRGSRSSTHNPAAGVVVPSSALNPRNVSNAATLSIQGLLNAINDERRASASHARSGHATTSGSGGVGGSGGGASAGATAIINVDTHGHLGSYCDYWRPACMLAAKKQTVPKSFYKYRFHCCGYEHDFKIAMDRLELLALFDRDLHWIHIFVSIFLCASVSYLGANILQHGYYKDIFAFLFCLVIAGSQYSLIKSVQPDAASPIHGFNKTVAYSRAIYFTLCGSLLLFVKHLQRDYDTNPPNDFIFFGVQYSPVQLASVTVQILYILLLCFPLIFSLGLFPQVNTFLMYSLEQIDMHIFGGNAAGSLLGSFLCVMRSIVGISILYGPLYAALSSGRGTQYILFSIFCAILIPLGYHLSRSASDFSHLWALIKNCIVSTYHDDDDEEDDDKHVINDDIDDHTLIKGSGTVSNTSTQKLTASSPKCAKMRREKSVAETNNENMEMSSLEKLCTADSERELDRKSMKLLRATSSVASESEQTLVKNFSANSRKALTSNSDISEEVKSGSVDISVDNADASSSAACANVKPNKKQMERRIDEDVSVESKETEESNNNNNNNNINNNNNNSNKLKSLDNENPLSEQSESIHKNINENSIRSDEDRATAVAAAAAAGGGGGDVDDDKLSMPSTTHPGDIMSTMTAAIDIDDAVIGGDGKSSNNNNNNNNNNNEVANDNENNKGQEVETPDPLPKKLQNTVNTRLKNDLVVTTFLAVAVLGLHTSTVFTVLQPDLNIVLYAFTGSLGLVLHYLIPQMRKHMPWLCFAKPILRAKEFGQFEVGHASKIMWFEKVYVYLGMVEKNILFPLLVISALTADAQTIAQKFGVPFGTLIVAVCAMKFLRNAYSDPNNQYLIIIFTVLIFRIDFAMASETFLVDYFFISLVFRKCCDFFLKLQFIVTYIAPWQITWGSAFHAFAQPFSVPHSAMLFLQAIVSAILSTPLNPFLGSAIFLTSYVRPIKFWERDYNTRRIDHSNTRLSSQLERDLGADDNNLNSIFYEHLTRSLQHSLCGDLLMGRWGTVNQGDCFVLASDYLNCLVHIIELGNGLCTFQMRGLEFRGTYCQQREVEAITEDVEDNDGCCCCDPGHLPRMLSANAMFSTRWLAWQVVAAQYVLEGYSISDNLASATLQVFEYRKVLITYYIKSIIYYVMKNAKLEQWLESPTIQEALQYTLCRRFVDLDPIFNYNLDEDYDFRTMGVTRSSFCHIYLDWINFCYDKRKEHQNLAPNPETTQPTSVLNNSSNQNLDCKSTPNLSSAMNTSHHVAHASHPAATQKTTGKSQSQQQLRTRPPQKSTTMSDSQEVSNLSSEHMTGSQSYGNILRQTSESAPGLTGAGLNIITPSATLEQGRLLGGNAFLNTSESNTKTSRLLGQAFGLNRNEDATAEQNVGHKIEITSPASGANQTTDAADKPVIRLKIPTVAKDSPVVSLCMALSLLARRTLATASHGSLTGVEFFLHGLHALFKGDFRITSPRDEWVFADMDLLHAVVAPAVKMALKLQQDHITNPDEFLDASSLYEAIDSCTKDLVISHEADPVWRSAVLRGAPNLLALRHVMEDGSDEYRIIRLTKRFLSFRVIKLNRECVRGLWAGQQQELIYLRNRNPERGSIQNAKQALRNIINSSCDQPIGYPIYVSPLTTSYCDTNEQLCRIIGGPITPESIKNNLMQWWEHIRERCRQGCSSGSGMENGNCGVGASSSLVAGGMVGDSTELPPVYISAPLYNTLTVSNFFGLRTSISPAPTGISPAATLSAQFGSDGLSNAIRSGGHHALVPLKPTSSTLLATLLSREREQEILREMRGIRKSQTQSVQAGLQCRSSSERERRATLPIASTSLGTVANPIGSNENNASDSKTVMTMNDDERRNQSSDAVNASPRYSRMSSSPASIGIGSIITTPGDYPRKNKGPICLASVAAAMATDASKTSEGVLMRKPRIELYKKVIIVDGAEIYDCLDLGRRIDVVWPSEEMRAHGGHLSWKEWVPRVGMVGYVVHYWTPNHPDPRLRSHVNRIVYLVEIGEHYVPVGEYGLREYNQILCDDRSSSESHTNRLNTRQELIRYDYEFNELRHQREHDGLTPILSSSLESPTSQLEVAVNNDAQLKALETKKIINTKTGAIPKIAAVSSSSSSSENSSMDDIPTRDGTVLGQRIKIANYYHGSLGNRFVYIWNTDEASKLPESQAEESNAREGISIEEIQEDGAIGENETPVDEAKQSPDSQVDSPKSEKATVLAETTQEQQQEQEQQLQQQEQQQRQMSEEEEEIEMQETQENIETDKLNRTRSDSSIMITVEADKMIPKQDEDKDIDKEEVKDEEREDKEDENEKSKILEVQSNEKSDNNSEATQSVIVREENEKKEEGEEEQREEEERQEEERDQKEQKLETNEKEEKLDLNASQNSNTSVSDEGELMIEDEAANENQKL